MEFKTVVGQAAERAANGGMGENAMKKTSLIAGAALSCVLASSAMAASPFWATLTGLPVPGSDGSTSVSTDTYYTGPLQFTTTSGKDFLVFCSDLNHNVSLGGKYEFILAPLTENGAGQTITQAVSNEIGQIAAHYKNDAGSWGVAAQAAIWELAYPGLSQTFSNATVETEYNKILGATYINTGTYATALVPYGYSNLWPSGGGFDPPQEMTGVPEPSTWVMMMLGFAALGFAGRRRRSTRDIA
jgi:hypothetical protein